MNAERDINYLCITFVVNSGASHHIISDKNYFSKITLFKSNMDINIAADKRNSGLKA